MLKSTSLSGNFLWTNYLIRNFNCAFFGADILFVLNMPPKKGTPVTLEKCGRCFKKHAPPLGDKCLPLLLVDPENTTDENPDEEIGEGLPDEENLEQPDDNLGAVGGPLPPKDRGNAAVAAQLANGGFTSGWLI
jgi:hypothetical protein